MCLLDFYARFPVQIDLTNTGFGCSLELRMFRAWCAAVALVILLSSVPSDAKVIADGHGGRVERTLAMIKPDGVRGHHADAIKKIIEAEGFKILTEKNYLLDDETAKTFYSEHSGRAFFPQLVQFMTSGPVLAMVLEKENAIKDWRALMGPTDSNKARIQAPDSVRAKFGLDGQNNCVHGSDSLEAASREIATFWDGKSQEEQGELKTIPHDEL